ncbi:MAG TPA: HEAT repeat domain-containing protein [Gammaproteobacteria bacterium]|nr:HEAT repeat domain-containing protein [Gammaproteobacteria bacterium]
MYNQIVLEIVKKIVIVQVALILILVLLTLLLNYTKTLYFKKKQKTIFDAEKFINNLIVKTEISLSLSHFPKKWSTLAILLPLLTKFDQKYPIKRWKTLKKLLVLEVILPLARKAAHSRFWINRFYAAEAFSITSEKSDNFLIKKLIEDEIPLIRFNILGAAIKSRKKALLCRVIKSMITERPLTQSIYLEAFENAPPKTISIIEDRLNHFKNPFSRATCYNILLKYPNKSINWDIDSDLNSKNIALKTSALKFYASIKKIDAIPILIEFLQSSEWEVRVISLHILGNLNATEAIPFIEKNLRHSNWWVRLTSAQTLKQLGDLGLQALKSQSIEEDHFAFDVSKHVLESF